MSRLRFALFLAAAIFGAGGVFVMNATGGVTETKDVVRPVLLVVVGQPEVKNWPEEILAHGAIQPWHEATVGSESNGLKVASVLVNVGEKVSRGQVLARFVSDSVKADLDLSQAQLAEAEAAVGEASANAERARNLTAAGALSAQQIQRMLTAEQTAKAKLEAQRALVQLKRLRLSQTEVLAPDDGVISSRSATVGAVVPAGQELFKLIRGGRLEWRAEVTPEESVRLQAGIAAQIRSNDGSVIMGKVRMVAPSMNERTHSVLAYIDLPSVSMIKAGMFVQGQILLGDSSAVVLPQSAVVVRDGNSYIFRLEEDGRVSQQRVTTGRRGGDRIEILSGIDLSARFVLDGAAFLSDGDVVSVASADERSRQEATPAGVSANPKG